MTDETTGSAGPPGTRTGDAGASDAAGNGQHAFAKVNRRWLYVAALVPILAVALGAGWVASGARTGHDAGAMPQAPAASTVAPAEANRIVAYVRAGCPHCAAAHEFLDGLVAERPELSVTYHDITKDPDALEQLQDLIDERGLAAVSVPVILVGNDVIVGFVGESSTGGRILAALDGAVGPAASADDLEFGSCAEEPAVSEPAEVTVPLLGLVSPDRIGLPLFAVALGTVDGFNPCAMWVLLFLLSMLVNMNDRRKMLLVAGTFVVVSGVVYYAFMAAWLGLFMVVGISRPIQIALGVFALVAGFLNVKDYFAFGRGFSISIPDSRKPAIYARSRKILTSKNLVAALIGVAALAVMVNMVELLCTAGLPAIFTQVLVANDLPRWQYYAYLALYILFYMIDDAIMVAVAVVTLSQTKLQERGGRVLKLVSGAVMLVLAVMLLLHPEWLAALG